MEPGGFEMFPTKGLEYLLVIVYLGALVWFWSLLRGGERPEAAPSFARSRRRRPNRWFDLPDGAYYHPGHSWALPEGGRMVRIGVDDFAQKLLGMAGAVRLPPVGTRLEQGSPAWAIHVDGRSFEQLAPVDGEVVARNEALREDPTLVNRDPYGAGWLLEVKPSRLDPNLKTLLRGDLARAWMRTSEEALFRRMPRELGVVMQDGGVPITGIARAISPDEWDRIVAEFLLTH
ncbi:MAG: hypothetical protein A2V63_04925 [Candidatus Eisenbacteria bacterium RBG_19FT_COMBO_70_11]|nr:MAG: hypothetical protein A2V63_04925 [Candidatus Eisenbacteria bacterium RBG_19FT_COMBO_70_11]